MPTLEAILTLNNSAFIASLTEANVALQGLDTAAAETASVIDGVVGPIMAVVAALVSVGVIVDKSIQSFSEFQQSMFQLEYFAGVGKDQIGALSEEIRQLSVQTGVSAEDIASAGYHIYSSGITGQAGFDALKYASEGAAMGMGNAGDVANTIAQLMVNFKVSALDAFNAMIVATRDGNMQVSDFANNFANVATEASMLHVPMNVAIADFDALTRANHNASESQTELTGIINGFLKPSKTLKDDVAALGFSSAAAMIQSQGLNGALQSLAQAGDLTDDSIGKLFANVRGLRGVMALIGNDKSVQSTLKDLNNDANVSSQAWKGYTQTLGYQFGTLKQSINELLTTIGEKLAPVVTALIQKVEPVVKGFQNWIASGNGLSSTFQILWQVIEPVVNVVGSLFEGLMIGAKFLSGILKPAFDVLVNVFNTSLKPALETLNNSLKPIYPLLKDIGELIGGALIVAITAIILAIAALIKVFSTLIDFGSKVFIMFNQLVNEAARWGSDLVGNIVKGIEGKINDVKNAVTNVANTIKNFLHFSKPDMGPLADVESWMPDMINTMVQGIQTNMPKLAVAINGALNNAQGGVYNRSFQQYNTVNFNGSNSNQWQQSQDMNRQLASMTYMAKYM